MAPSAMPRGTMARSQVIDSHDHEEDEPPGLRGLAGACGEGPGLLPLGAPVAGLVGRVPMLHVLTSCRLRLSRLGGANAPGR